MPARFVSGRAVDLLVLDLPPRLAIVNEALLRRLAAHARRIGVQLLVLEPADLAAPIHGALAEAAGVRLSWSASAGSGSACDIVGQRTAVTVAKNRFGRPAARWSWRSATSTTASVPPAWPGSSMPPSLERRRALPGSALLGHRYRPADTTAAAPGATPARAGGRVRGPP